MKANNAPEKIYILANRVRYYKEEGSIEYIRTDAFIEKACEFIKDHHHEFSFCITEEYKLGFNTQKIIDDFKKYMKGE